MHHYINIHIVYNFANSCIRNMQLLESFAYFPTTKNILCAQEFAGACSSDRYSIKFKAGGIMQYLWNWQYLLDFVFHLSFPCSLTVCAFHTVFTFPPKERCIPSVWLTEAWSALLNCRNVCSKFKEETRIYTVFELMLYCQKDELPYAL